MNATGYLAAAYSIIWVIIAVYVVYLGRRQAGLRRQIEVLQIEMSERNEPGEQG